jgi:hydrogenase small subunit
MPSFCYHPHIYSLLSVLQICIGCTMPGFPDKFMPFMDEPPGAKLSSGIISATYGKMVRSLRKLTQDTVNKEPSWRHTDRELTTGYHGRW